MTQTTLKIDGMMCGMCESHINDAIRKEFPVKKITASHSKGICVIISDAPLDEAKLRKTLTIPATRCWRSSPSPMRRRAACSGCSIINAVLLPQLLTASLQLRKFEAAARTGFHFVEKSALRRSFLL